MNDDPSESEASLLVMSEESKSKTKQSKLSKHSSSMKMTSDKSLP